MNNSKKDNPFDYLFRVLEKLPKTTEKIVVVFLISLVMAILIFINYILVIAFNISIAEEFTNFETAVGLFAREIAFLILFGFAICVLVGIILAIKEIISDVKKAIHEVKIEKERESLQ